jgi:hypothetical protein
MSHATNVVGTAPTDICNFALSNANGLSTASEPAEYAIGLIQIRFFRWFAESVPITIVSEKLRLVPNTPFREQWSKDSTAFQERSCIILAFSSSGVDE